MTIEDEMKRAMKEAIREWLDAQFVKLGKWSLAGFAAAALAALLYLILWANGWRHVGG